MKTSQDHNQNTINKQYFDNSKCFNNLPFTLIRYVTVTYLINVCSMGTYTFYIPRQRKNVPCTFQQPSTPRILRPFNVCSIRMLHCSNRTYILAMKFSGRKTLVTQSGRLTPICSSVHIHFQNVMTQTVVLCNVTDFVRFS